MLTFRWLDTRQAGLLSDRTRHRQGGLRDTETAEFAGPARDHMRAGHVRVGSEVRRMS